MGTKDLNEARIYVGTYAKYNNGSLQGEWVELSEFYDWDEFMERCAEIHEDEHGLFAKRGSVQDCGSGREGFDIADFGRFRRPCRQGQVIMPCFVRIVGIVGVGGRGRNGGDMMSVVVEYG